MCGIAGFYNIQKPASLIKAAIGKQSHRGRDHCAIKHLKHTSYTFSHHLHAINGHVPQPLIHKNTIFTTNCEVYNASELTESAKNDADALHKHIVQHGNTKDALNKVDGVYSYAYYDKPNNTITVARDLLGVKPLWYYYDGDSFAYASEKKTLLAATLEATNIYELNPRHILTYNGDTGELTTTYRGFYEVDEAPKDYEAAAKTVKSLLERAVEKRIQTDKQVALLFSGGLDSVVLAQLLKKHGIEFKAYFAHTEENARDYEQAMQAAQQLDIELETVLIREEELEAHLGIVLDYIDDVNYIKAVVGVPIYVATKKAAQDGAKIVLSGTGAEELYGGYHRQQRSDINKECLSGLRRKYYRDLYRDDTLTMANTVELRVPYLDRDLIAHSLTLPGHFKTNDAFKKRILRDAAKHLGVPKQLAEAKKISTQYGSGVAKATKHLADQYDQHVSNYIASLSSKPRTRVAGLLSTGKDSCLSIHRATEQNYDVTTLITIQPENTDSYMSHAPNTDLAELQARAADLPLIEQPSKGEKELELEDFKTAFQTAKESYNAEGVVAGAIRSQYQRQRIERIADEVGMKAYAPIWAMNEAAELRLLLKLGFEFIIVKVAAYGLDEEWLGDTITEKHIEKLEELHEQFQINVAGEGGEYESLVLDAPFFTKKIRIKESRVEQVDDYVSRLIIEDAELVEKTGTY